MTGSGSGSGSDANDDISSGFLDKLSITFLLSLRLPSLELKKKIMTNYKYQFISEKYFETYVQFENEKDSRSRNVLPKFARTLIFHPGQVSPTSVFGPLLPNLYRRPSAFRSPRHKSCTGN